MHSVSPKCKIFFPFFKSQSLSPFCKPYLINWTLAIFNVDEMVFHRTIVFLSLLANKGQPQQSEPPTNTYTATLLFCKIRIKPMTCTHIQSQSCSPLVNSWKILHLPKNKMHTIHHTQIFVPHCVCITLFTPPHWYNRGRVNRGSTEEEIIF